MPVHHTWDTQAGWVGPLEHCCSVMHTVRPSSRVGIRVVGLFEQLLHGLDLVLARQEHQDVTLRRVRRALMMGCIDDGVVPSKLKHICSDISIVRYVDKHLIGTGVHKHTPLAALGVSAAR